MYRFALNLKRFLLVAADLIALELALLVTLMLRYGTVTGKHWEAHFVPFLIISLMWVIGLFVTGLYDLSRARNTVAFFRSFLEGMLVNLLLGFAFFYLVPVWGIEPRTNLLLFFAISLLFIYLWRLIFNKYITKGLFKNRLIYVGPAEDAIVLRDLIAGNSLGFELAGAVHTTPRVTHEADGLRWEYRLDSIPELIRTERIQSIVLGSNVDEHPELRESLYRSLDTSVALIDRKDIEETLTGRIPVAYVDKAWFLRNLRESEKLWFEIVKRSADIVIAVPFVILTAIVYPFVALGTKVTSPGPVLFRQKRVGKHGKIFEITKFRTMHDDPNPTPQFTAENDPRITTFGRFLRSVRIDELPQVLQVIRGDMSFVGPRPEQPEFVAELQTRMPYYALRHLTRPGLTGWSQVQYGYAKTLEENLMKLQYDLFYVKNRSLILDLAILLKTINIVLRRQGS